MFAEISNNSTTAQFQEQSLPVDRIGSLRAERFLDQVRITYVASALSVDENDVTYVQLCWHAATRQMWICQLRIASPFRRRGFGRMLVDACEEVARRLDAQCIYVFPLQHARTFWMGEGYKPHARMARVLTKCPQASKGDDATDTQLATLADIANELLSRPIRFAFLAIEDSKTPPPTFACLSGKGDNDNNSRRHRPRER